MTPKNHSLAFDEGTLTYVAVKETIESEELGRYTSFGISVRVAGREIRRIRDVSTDEEAVVRLTRLCTELKLSPEHLDDVVDDFLCTLA